MGGGLPEGPRCANPRRPACPGPRTPGGPCAAQPRPHPTPPAPLRGDAGVPAGQAFTRGGPGPGVRRPLARPARPQRPPARRSLPACPDTRPWPRAPQRSSPGARGPGRRGTATGWGPGPRRAVVGRALPPSARTAGHPGAPPAGPPSAGHRARQPRPQRSARLPGGACPCALTAGAVTGAGREPGPGSLHRTPPGPRGDTHPSPGCSGLCALLAAAAARPTSGRRPESRPFGSFVLRRRPPSTASGHFGQGRRRNGAENPLPPQPALLVRHRGLAWPWGLPGPPSPDAPIPLPPCRAHPGGASHHPQPGPAATRRQVCRGSTEGSSAPVASALHPDRSRPGRHLHVRPRTQHRGPGSPGATGTRPSGT